jgi:branched-chain amino acid transport system ATP-binding protein
MIMLEIRELCVNYGYVEALINVSFTVNKGDIVTIIGANGAGKSTLLKTISGIIKKKSGNILLNGEILPAKPYKIVARGVIHVPEGRRVFPGLTVTENLIMGGMRTRKAEAKQRLEEMLDLFPILRQRSKQLAGTLSGGEQQMLAIARGMMAAPSLLLFDEPSLGLAPLIVEQMFELIKKINTMGITVLLVEQNAKRALAISNYAYVLENGCIITQGDSAVLSANEEIQKAYLGE